MTALHGGPSSHQIVKLNVGEATKDGHCNSSTRAVVPVSEAKIDMMTATFFWLVEYALDEVAWWDKDNAANVRGSSDKQRGQVCKWL